MGLYLKVNIVLEAFGVGVFALWGEKSVVAMIGPLALEIRWGVIDG